MRLSSFLAGVGLGAGVALLFAPRSGEETREVLAEKAREGRRYAEGRAAELRGRANELKNRAAETAEQGREAVARHTKAASAAVQAATDTYKSEASSA